MTFFDMLGGKPTQAQVMGSMGKTLNDVTFRQMPKTVGRFAGSSIGRGIARAIPGLSLLGGVTDVADIVAGDESFGNKAMDATAMAIRRKQGQYSEDHLVLQPVQVQEKCLAMEHSSCSAEVSLLKNVEWKKHLRCYKVEE